MTCGGARSRSRLKLRYTTLARASRTSTTSLSSHRQTVEELLTRTNGLFLNHSYKCNSTPFVSVVFKMTWPSCAAGSIRSRKAVRPRRFLFAQLPNSRGMAVRMPS